MAVDVRRWHCASACSPEGLGHRRLCSAAESFFSARFWLTKQFSAQKSTSWGRLPTFFFSCGLYSFWERSSVPPLSGRFSQVRAREGGLKEICIAHAPPALSWRLHHSSPGSAPSGSSGEVRTSCRRAAVGTRVPKAGVVTAGWLHSASVAAKLLLLHDPSLRASTPAACRSPGQDAT